VRRRVRCPHARGGDATFKEFVGVRGHIREAVPHLDSDGLPIAGEPGLVDLGGNMHDVGPLGVDEVHANGAARRLREDHVQGHVQVLLILPLVDDHLILGFLLQEVPQLGEEKHRHEGQGA